MLAVRVPESVGPSGSLYGAGGMERTPQVRHGLEARLVVRGARRGTRGGKEDDGVRLLKTFNEPHPSFVRVSQECPTRCTRRACSPRHPQGIR